MKRLRLAWWSFLIWLLSCTGTGCGHDLPPSLIHDARAAIAKTDAPMAAAGPALDTLGAFVELACVQPTPPPADKCAEAERLLNGVIAPAFELSQEVSQVVDDALAVMEVMVQ